MSKRTCTACGIPKGGQCFYPGKGACKPCIIAAVIENRQAKAEHYRNYAREYARLPKRIAKQAEWRNSEAGKRSRRDTYRINKGLCKQSISQNASRGVT